MNTELDISQALSSSAPDFDEQPSAEQTLREIIARTRSLYTLPAVALEVIQLTNNLQVDARLLKECIEKDPALTAKILRVVNSSLFGLPREVSDLNQALALLGIKPLKLLVLGFSLPDGLFVEVAGDQLQWFWRTTLIRAVTAREISERLWNRPGDDAFLAGMLQDLGVLVLLNQLRRPYAEFLGRVIDEHGDLSALEAEFLGFDHTRLTAELLRSWNMPDLLVDVIAEKRDFQNLAHKQTPVAAVARVLHLANLLAELVGQNRLQVLPDLLEAGEAYCGLNKDKLRDLVPVLQEKVRQLADVLSLDLPAGADYTQIIIEAHAQMAEISEHVAERLSRSPTVEEKAYERVLTEANELRSAVQQFLHPRPSVEVTTSSTAPTSHKSDGPAHSRPVGASSTVVFLAETLPEKLTWLVGDCRSKRLPLSVMLVELRGGFAHDPREQQVIGQIFDAACRSVEVEGKHVESITARRWALILPACERHHAVRLAHDLLHKVNRNLERLAVREDLPPRVVGAGVASVALPPKNFPPLDLLTSAERCLSAAQSSGASTVKSLEIF